MRLSHREFGTLTRLLPELYRSCPTLEFLNAMSTIAEARLTPREGEVAFWLVQGKSNWEIASIIGSAPRTVASPSTAQRVTLLTGAMGAGVGVGVDALIRRDRIVYPRKPRPQARLVPAIGPGVRGVVLGLTW